MIKGLENLKIFLRLLCPGVSRCVQGAQCSSNFSQFPLRAAELGTDLIHTWLKVAAEDSIQHWDYNHFSSAADC